MSPAAHHQIGDYPSAEPVAYWDHVFKPCAIAGGESRRTPKRQRDPLAHLTHRLHTAAYDPRGVELPHVPTHPLSAPSTRPAHGNAYNLFIFVLTVVSLVVMVVMWLLLTPEIINLLRTYDNAICVIFLIDFL